MTFPSGPGQPPLLADDNALFLDVDGTLAELAPRPEAVVVPPAVIADLARLQQRLGGALALLSGRPLDQLDALLSPLRLSAGALHGHQWRHHGHGNSSQDEDDGDAPAFLRGVGARARELAAQAPGVMVEDKGAALALHWRGNPAMAGRLQAFARAELEHAPQHQGQPAWRLQPGDHVIEFVPAGSDKGRTLARLMRLPPFAGRRPVHVGDDLTDEHAFAAAHALGGSSIVVGTRAPSQARHRLASPAALHAWLHANVSLSPAKDPAP